MLGDIAACLLLAQAEAEAEDEGGSFLVSPGLGLMIWTLVLFGFTMWVLEQGRVPEDRRGAGEAGERDPGEHRGGREAARRRPTSCSSEYRERLKEAREQAEDIVARARKAAEAAAAEAAAEGKEKREELVAAARTRHRDRDPPLAGADPQGGRRPDRARHREGDPQVARRDEDHQRLVEEALAEVDFSALPARQRRAEYGEAASGGDRSRIRRGLFEVAKEDGKLDEIHEQLGEFADALAENRDLQVFFFSPYFSSAEKREGIANAVSAPTDELMNFLELLAEKHRMPAIFRIRERFDELWAEENKRLEVRADERRRSSTESWSSASATRSSARPTARSTLRATSTRTSSAASCCASATWCSTPACAQKLERLRKEVARRLDVSET